ncbi:iron(III) transport system ATP-binding protein [Noviherbaspirillum humi]|uniref:Iron(III) transport system ATP-binding protein n=1 Tax=Noviherbaspirillum humi TaxID=1688639 RepID=A0A239IL26_9BURK|nr:ABC transporter ATP-binding protein [Noviherbaspirillum humi]SNS94241.1 iron(III) transport system ATP-binding protein [Noviherbaspirillum humi]
MLSVKALFTEYPNDQGQIVKAAQNVTFDVPEGKLFTLLGPSGCGKTTTLRSIAGLEKPKSGEITVAGRTVYSSAGNVFVQPNQRAFGMVFQSYAIWPHMNVFKNAAFPLEVGSKKYSKKDIEQRVMRVLAAVGLDHLADREATKLSGGQQQRLALARALVMEPKLLLLDEPLSNLDAKLRERMRFELKRMQRELGLTTIYVTHDQSEALALSHEIAVMREGQIIQIGSPRDIYERPNSKFVADFVGLTNFVEATVLAPENNEGGYRVESSLGQLSVVSLEALRPGEQVLISIRPEDVELCENRPDGTNVIHGTVDFKVFLGEYLDFQVKFGDRSLLARVHPSLKTPVGEGIYACLNPEKCIAIRDDVALKKAA